MAEHDRERDAARPWPRSQRPRARRCPSQSRPTPSAAWPATRAGRPRRRRFAATYAALVRSSAWARLRSFAGSSAIEGCEEALGPLVAGGDVGPARVDRGHDGSHRRIRASRGGRDGDREPRAGDDDGTDGLSGELLVTHADLHPVGFEGPTPELGAVDGPMVALARGSRPWAAEGNALRARQAGPCPETGWRRPLPPGKDRLAVGQARGALTRVWRSAARVPRCWGGDPEATRRQSTSQLASARRRRGAAPRWRAAARRCASPARDAELVVQVGQVLLDRGLGDDELVGDRSRRTPAR